MGLEKLQPKIFQEFQRILQSGKLSHAYLFSGDFASFEMAVLLAQSRFCDSPIDALPCGQCRSCRLIAENDFSDVKVIEPEGQMIKTATIRDLLREFSSSGFEGQSQVFIIRDADKMHTNAANSLLKFIEEPQSDTYMILLTQDESRILRHYFGVSGTPHYWIIGENGDFVSESATDPSDPKTYETLRKLTEK